MHEADATAGDRGLRSVLIFAVALTVAKSVDFHDFGGFSGSYSVNNIGKAEVSGVGGKYTITGSADGNYTDNPNKPVTATFRIVADC